MYYFYGGFCFVFLFVVVFWSITQSTCKTLSIENLPSSIVLTEINVCGSTFTPATCYLIGQVLV